MHCERKWLAYVRYAGAVKRKKRCPGSFLLFCTNTAGRLCAVLQLLSLTRGREVPPRAPVTGHRIDRPE